MAKQIKKILGDIFLILAFSVFVFAAMEIVARAFYPEFRNQVHGQNLTLGKHRFYHQAAGMQVRAPYDSFESPLRPGQEIILITGDSITAGYGLAYEDVYWAQLQRLLDAVEPDAPRVVAVARGGYSAQDMRANLEGVIDRIDQDQLQTRHILYQFNFNDITPYSKEQLVKLGDTWILRNPWYRKFLKYRERVLNRSVLLRVLSYYAARMAFKKQSGTCEERGINALDDYTWTFGAASVKKESDALWEEFDEAMGYIKGWTQKRGIAFSIFISPILEQIDTRGVGLRPSRELDFSCATLDPKERLFSIGKKYGIPIIDPEPYVRASFERRVKEGNYTPYYFISDHNHFNDVASRYVAEQLFAYFIRTKQGQEYQKEKIAT